MKHGFFTFIFLALFTIFSSGCVGIGPQATVLKNVKIEKSQKNYSSVHAVFTFKEDETLVAGENGKPIDMQIVDTLNNLFSSSQIRGEDLEISVKTSSYSNMVLIGDSKFTTKVEVFNASKQKIGEFEVETLLYKEIGLRGGIHMATSRIYDTIKEKFIK
ncbi:MAG: hypothetical protein II131_03695 [Neisseriaceae bacterium]|nr:hypothetical protein [Neisseriaceae bacterium]